VFKVEFDITKNKPNLPGVNQNDADIAYSFSKQMFREFGDILKAIVLFGSNAKKGPAVPDELPNLPQEANAPPGPADKKPGDIDILVIVDDVSLKLTSELVETYRIIVKKLILENSERLHITSLKLSTFWAYIRAGDPVGLNILREGVPLLDTGFFDPLKAILNRGMIRPSPESVFTYFARAPKTLFNSKWHIMQGVIYLYWAVIDASHAALMTLDSVPPSPEDVGGMLAEKLVKPGYISKKCIPTVEKFYKVYKDITRREIKEITGKQFDDYFKEAEEYVECIRAFIEKRKANM
jgi:hypothetical protein